MQRMRTERKWSFYYTIFSSRGACNTEDCNRGKAGISLQYNFLSLLSNNQNCEKDAMHRSIYLVQKGSPQRNE